MHAGAADLYRLGVEVDLEIGGVDDRLGMALRTAHHRVNAGDQLVLVEGLGHVVVGAEAEALDLVLDAGKAGEDQNRRLDLGDAQRAENFVSRHVRQVQVEQDDVVVVELAEIDALFAEVGGVDVERFGLEHQLDALRRRTVVFDQENAHAYPLQGPWFPGTVRSGHPPRARLARMLARFLESHATEEWLTEPDSRPQVRAVRIAANRPK